MKIAKKKSVECAFCLRFFAFGDSPASFEDARDVNAMKFPIIRNDKLIINNGNYQSF